MGWQDDSVLWGRTHIKYQFSYADRKTLSISVHPNLDITVTAPLRTDPESIRAKVLKKAPWIRQAIRDFELYLPKQPERQYIAGETHRYLGRQYRLKFLNDNASDKVKCYRGCLWVSKQHPQEVKEQLHDWYRVRAQKVLTNAMEKYVPRVLGKNSATPPFTIRLMKTRWGSCSKAGRIFFNLELIKAPGDCIEYVVVHELCHLMEHNHSTRFWRLVAKALPDYEERKRRLNRYADV